MLAASPLDRTDWQLRHMRGRTYNEPHAQSVYRFDKDCRNLTLWCGACLNCFVLVINRLLDVSNKAWMYMLFKDRRTYVVLLLPFLYTLYFCFFTPPILFNTNHMAWFFFTFAGGRKPEEEASFTIAFRSVLAFLKTTLLQLPTYRQQLVSCGSNMSTVCSVLKSFSASIES
ncbi:hypothetical protein Y032_0026g1395 [Ancylostoma ceylanicum]|uniref:Uncharacterized protein n=1 Tax=Ancylostoma ceylanicum TaxID=53326 RepID=A0A016UV36_9BILA|nr:hypothetical protein Y032_0026g1395 [Ancylostoma ceylanicum]